MREINHKMQNLDKKSIQEINVFQNHELKKLLLYLSENSTFYQHHFAKNNIDIDSGERFGTALDL